MSDPSNTSEAFDIITEEEVNGVYDSDTTSQTTAGSLEGEQDRRHPGALDLWVQRLWADKAEPMSHCSACCFQSQRVTLSLTDQGLQVKLSWRDQSVKTQDTTVLSTSNIIVICLKHMLWVSRFVLRKDYKSSTSQLVNVELIQNSSHTSKQAFQCWITFGWRFCQRPVLV